MAMNHRKVAWCLLLCCSQSLGAGELDIQEELDIRKDPVLFPVGPFEAAPIFEAAESYNDNIFSRDEFQKGSFLTQFHAGGQLALQRQMNEYKLVYTLQSSQYHDSPQDDYVDHFVGGTSHLEFTSRHRLDIGLGYLDSHYQRGVFLGRDLISPTQQEPLGRDVITFTQREQPDQYHLHSANAAYRYGRAEAKGNLELKFGIQDYTFQNNREYTEKQDRTQFVVTPGFFFRIAPKTILQVQAENYVLKHRQNDVSSIDNQHELPTCSYQNKDPLCFQQPEPASSFDYTKHRFLIGGAWSYSEKIKLDARVGYLMQSFDNAKYKGIEDVTWDLSAHWSPMSYSSLNLTIARDVSPSIASNNLRSSDRFRLDWAHDWTPRVTTNVFGAIENAENQAFVRNAENQAFSRVFHRNDEYTSAGIDLRYGIRRWLGVGVNYSYRILRSDIRTLDFTQNVIMFYITGNPRISDEARTPWSTWY